MRWIKVIKSAVLFGTCVSALFSWGCAGQKPVLTFQDRKSQVKIEAGSDVKRVEAKGATLIEKGKRYRLEQTPFGYVKRRATPPAVKQSVSASKAQAEKKTAPAKRNERKPAGNEKAKAGSKKAESSPVLRAGGPGTKKGKGEVVFNFDDADLYEVIRTMAELLKINYIVEPNIRGRVTIHTAGMLKEQDLFPVFYQILEVNGLTAVKEGSLYRIVKLKDASRLPAVLKTERGGMEGLVSERIIIQIIRLKYISSQELSKLLSPFISAQGTIISYGNTNTLIVVDKGINILKILRLVDAFDVDVFGKVKYRFFPLENADAEQMVKMLDGIFGPIAAKANTDLKFIGIDRLNTILALSSNEGIFPRVKEFVNKLDVPSEGIEPRIYVYPVKNGEAKQLAELLNQVFSKTGTVKKKNTGAKEEKVSKNGKKPVGNPFAHTTVTRKKKKRVSIGGMVGGAPSSTLRGEIRITADEIRNSLIIEAIPADYRVLEDILKKIDVMPRQVLIEATIAEITLDAATQLGVEWNYVKGRGGLSGSLQNATMGNAGLKYVIGQADRWTSAISALASKNKVNILSSPSLLASDNKEAKINVSTEVPVPNAQYEYTSGTEPVIQTNIQYRNTGVILTVTPHINESGLVSMDISQEVSEQSASVQVGNQTVPSFFKRSVDTTLTVRDGQTIVLGGLMRKTSDHGVSGVPWLVNIPVLRYIFGRESKSSAKTELIILITPRVIINLHDVDTVTAEFKAKLGGAMRGHGRQ